MTPKISVIVPVYNTEKYLHRCVDSILAQTFTDFELLLIDDGSTDSSGAICDEYAQKDSRVRVFHKKNGGVSSARNLGLDNAKGEWISFVDSDDWIELSMLDEVYKKVCESCSDIVFVDININFPNNKNQYYESFRWKYTPQDSLKTYLKQSRLCPCWALIRRSIIEINKIRFPENLTIYEDFYTMVRIVYKSAVIGQIEKTLYNYRMQNSSAIHTIQQERILINQQWAYSSILNFFEDNGVYHLYASSLYARILHDYQHWALDPLMQEKFREIYPLKKDYIWQCSTINIKLKIIMWCITNKMLYVAKILCVIRNFILNHIN